MYELHPRHGVVLGIGAHGTIDVVDATAAVYYGTTTPVGAFVFVEAHPSADGARAVRRGVIAP